MWKTFGWLIVSVTGLAALAGAVLAVRKAKQTMSALENLTDAVTGLTASVDRAVTVLATPHPTDAQVQAAADAVVSQTSRLDAATVAAGGTPAPAPTPATP